MIIPMRTFLLAGAFVLMAQGCARDAATEELRFSIEDGPFRNDFLRDGPIAAHVVLKSAKAARLVVAFPAGNSGAGVWFAEQQAPVQWSAPRNFEPVTQTLEDGGVRRGVRFETEASAGRLKVAKAILSNIRVLRDYGYAGQTPSIVDAAPTTDGRKATWERRRIDGAAGYFLSIEALNGAVETAETGAPVTFTAKSGDALRLRVTTLTGDPPLTGIPEERLLSASAAKEPRLRNVLAFLAYEEKFLAGSWQYDTYFGRDTLMTLALLGTALRPEAVEAGLAAVLDRLSESGEVAHEEDIGEYALLRRAENGAPADDAPILDYKMIDDDFMLAPALARYLLDTPEGGERAGAFLSRTAPGGETYRELVLRNLGFIVDAARPYGEDPNWSRFISVRSVNPPVGNWRDSSTGLGGGVFPYDVNAALVPAALAAAHRLADSGLLGSAAAMKELAIRAGRFAGVWSSTAADHFNVSVDAETAKKRAEEAARLAGLDAAPASWAQSTAPVEFAALALDRNGAPIQVMHSDVGYLLLFGAPSEREVDQAASLILSPFPSGLITPVGMMVANAAYAPAELAADFGPDRYHGAVIWSWQQALMAAGIERQLSRSDLTEATRSRLDEALHILRRAIEAGCDYQSAELWTWAADKGKIARVPFGQRAGDETESNAAQLWSTVLLAQRDFSCAG